MISTASITLRPTIEADLAFVRAAEQAAENACFIRQWTRERHWQACTHPDERHWIVMNAEAESVGYVILVGVKNPDQSLLIQRLVITAKEQGYGRATLIQVLCRAFHEFKAHRVWLDVVTTNDRARHLYQTLGFVTEGCLRESIKTSEGFASAEIMSILRPEFLRLSSQGRGDG
ncbi:GNAT family N-acetyltransferase [Leptolyngbya sp. PCC 6406]|uniref:GNAT family N-acetyltransferase n=1 Tax=Leptolyngbya sp. PCC 6406 TaxID=1173264 RepID=UPI0002ACF614|nr:GNAT family protein [Leptolyngbya sp. PCC 6406]